MRKLVSTKHLTYDEWLQWRRKGIGGSDIPAILGKSPWSSAFDVWLEKTGQYEREDSELAKERMYWGGRLEETVAQEFCKRNSKKVRKVNYILQHDELDYMLANVDRMIVGEDAGLECKTTNSLYKDEGCPETYALQSQGYMFVTGKPLWYVALLAGGQRYYQYEVPRDDALINDVILPACKDFWELVTSGEMPPVDGSEACAKMLNERYTMVDENDIELPEDAYELLQQWDLLNEQSKQVQERMDLISNMVKAWMQENDKAHIFDRKVFWTQVNSKKFDAKAFQAEHPELYAKFVKENTHRRFSVK